MACKGSGLVLAAAEKGDWIQPEQATPTQGGRVATKFVLKKGSTGKFRFNLIATTQSGAAKSRPCADCSFIGGGQPPRIVRTYSQHGLHLYSRSRPTVLRATQGARRLLLMTLSQIVSVAEAIGPPGRRGYVDDQSED